MKVYEIEFRDMIGVLTVFAETTDVAASTFSEWYEPRFGRVSGAFTVKNAAPARVDRDLHLRRAIAYGNAGIASFVHERGWIVLPPTMEEAGLLYLEERPVKAFSVQADDEELENLLIFAASHSGAREILRVWSATHAHPRLIKLRLKPMLMAALSGEYEHLAIQAMQGAVGVAGPSKLGVRILPPWHEDAGAM